MNLNRIAPAITELDFIRRAPEAISQATREKPSLPCFVRCVSILPCIPSAPKTPNIDKVTELSL